MCACTTDKYGFKQCRLGVCEHLERHEACRHKSTLNKAIKKLQKAVGRCIAPLKFRQNSDKRGSIPSRGVWAQGDIRRGRPLGLYDGQRVSVPPPGNEYTSEHAEMTASTSACPGALDVRARA